MRETVKNCPYCAEKILDAAVLCKHCGKELSDSPTNVVTRPPVPPAKKGNPALLVLLLGLIGSAIFGGLYFFGTSDGINHSQAPVQVRFSVTGRSAWPVTHDEARHAAVTYSTPGGGTQQNEVELPWTFASSGFRGGEFLYMSAQNKNSDGCVKVEIFKDSALYKTAESCGEYVIASVNGSR